ncbi:AraC family transcriptional regulator [Sulfitobacter noctilucae]|uniref:AraC family transcriptional regulator n=1 Tax=Sulfitobacter noctilucae TaxID=1342302 RepID=UPI000469811F|nr:AraC family transcriptional regulator [Sulfitobacter noctilucae]
MTTARADQYRVLSREEDFSPQGTLLSPEPKFATANYSHAKRYIEENTEGLFNFSMRQATGFHYYDMRSARLDKILFKLIRLDTQTGYDIRSELDADTVFLHLVFRGTAEFKLGQSNISATPGQMVLIEATAPCSKRWSGSTQMLTIWLSRRALEQVAISEMGAQSDEPLDFGNLQVMDVGTVPTLWNYILTICQDLSEEVPSLTGQVSRLAERTLLLMLLNTIPNSYSTGRIRQSASTLAPYYVRRVEQYIQQCAHEPISMQDLVEISGVSARSIYNGFKTYRASTPMLYLKSVRLDIARAELSKGYRHGANSVTEAAMKAGYTNMSQFSRDYRIRFRESPSETLRQA